MSLIVLAGGGCAESQKGSLDQDRRESNGTAMATPNDRDEVGGDKVVSSNDQAYAREQIHFHVWSGFHTTAHTRRVLLEDIFDGDLDEQWLDDAIREETVRKRTAEQQWPDETDCDRLDRVFEKLNNSGILALHNAGYTQSDGSGDVSDEYHHRGGEASGLVGFCFYHGQDLERAISGDGLMLAYGDMTGSDAQGVAVGHRICEAFRAAGFTVEWSGSLSVRIELPGFCWQRRGP